MTREKVAIYQAICKRCLIDHNHSTRSSVPITSSDLAGYYDRIIYTAADLALLLVNIPHSRRYSMFDSIERIIHRIRTTYGDSEIPYGGDYIGK